MKQTIALCMLLFAFAFVGCKSNHVALNDIQVIGSHNSYKIAIERPLYDYLHTVEPKKNGKFAIHPYFFRGTIELRFAKFRVRCFL